MFKNQIVLNNILKSVLPETIGGKEQKFTWVISEAFMGSKMKFTF
jgi:hypothetical protein